MENDCKDFGHVNPLRLVSTHDQKKPDVGSYWHQKPMFEFTILHTAFYEADAPARLDYNSMTKDTTSRHAHA